MPTGTVDPMALLAETRALMSAQKTDDVKIRKLARAGYTLRGLARKIAEYNVAHGTKLPATHVGLSRLVTGKRTMSSELRAVIREITGVRV